MFNKTRRGFRESTSTAIFASILTSIIIVAASCGPVPELPTATPPPPTKTISSLSTQPTPPATPTHTPAVQPPHPTLPPLPRVEWDPNTGRASWIQEAHPDIHQQLVTLPWVSDGPDALERAVLDQIIDATALSPALAQDIIFRHWVKDGVDTLERQMITALVDITKTDRSLAAEIAAMPFLYNPSHSDLIILESIQNLLGARRVVALTQSPLYKAGITDGDAPLLAAAAAGPKGSAAQRYLRAQGVAIETHTFDDVIPPITVTILRRKGASADPSTIRHVRDAAATVESIMDTTLPQRHLIVAFDSALVDIATAATFHSQLIAVRDERVKSRPDGRLHLLYREIARHWWHGNADWIDEGMVETIANIGSRIDDAAWIAQPLPRLSCQAPNIRALDQSPPDRDRAAHHCNRHLGESLFRDLHSALDAPAFARSVRELFIVAPAGISEVRAAFPDLIDIIDHHYQGDRNAPHRWDPDDAIDAPHHNAIAWTQKPAHHQNRVRFTGHIIAPAMLADQHVAFTISDHQRSLATILPPLDNQELEVEDIKYVVAEEMNIRGDRFDVSFRWPTGAGSPDGKTITIWGYRDHNPIPVIGESADPLSISLIRNDPNPPAIIPTPRPTRADHVPPNVAARRAHPDTHHHAPATPDPESFPRQPRRPQLRDNHHRQGLQPGLRPDVQEIHPHDVEPLGTRTVRRTAQPDPDHDPERSANRPDPRHVLPGVGRQARQRPRRLHLPRPRRSGTTPVPVQEARRRHHHPSLPARHRPPRTRAHQLNAARNTAP